MKHVFCYYLKLTTHFEDASNWSDSSVETVSKHAAFLDALGKEGILLFAGRTLYEPGDKNLFGIALFYASDLEAAKKIVADDPVLAAGIMQHEVFPFSLAINHMHNAILK